MSRTTGTMVLSHLPVISNWISLLSILSLSASVADTWKTWVPETMGQYINMLLDSFVFVRCIFVSSFTEARFLSLLFVCYVCKALVAEIMVWSIINIFRAL